MSDPSRTPDGAAILAAVEAKRGYLLPYHRMLGAWDPGLLAAYDGFYERLTLAPRVFTMAERELVWAALLVASREAHGQLHMRRAVKAGLSAAQLAAAVAVAGAVEAWVALAFAPTHWAEWVPEGEARARYAAVFDAACAGLDPAIAEISAVVCHAARRTHDGMRWHLPRAFAAGATQAQMAEGLSYLLLPCGGPTLIDAVDAWDQAAKAGACPGPYLAPQTASST